MGKFGSAEMLFVFGMFLLNAAFWISLHFAVGWLVVSLPKGFREKRFDCRHPFFQVSRGEMRFYRRIGLPRWKDRLPQHNSDFDKRHLKPILSRAYLEEFLLVTCQSEIIHYLIAAAGYFSLLFSLLCKDAKASLPLFFGIATAMAAGNLPFSMIQRYNRYRLLKTLRYCKA